MLTSVMPPPTREDCFCSIKRAQISEWLQFELFEEQKGSILAYGLSYIFRLDYLNTNFLDFFADITKRVIAVDVERYLSPVNL